MSKYSIIVMSCDKYKCLIEPFETLINKYWKNNTDITYVYGNDIWTKRYREALKELKEEYVITLLDDFFIRNNVDAERIQEAINIMDKYPEVIVCNFEKQYREGLKVRGINNWEAQKQNQMYLCSCQPSIWRRTELIKLLNKDMTAWEWETQKIKSNKIFLINTGDYIIDVGYRHQSLEEGWGITRGKLSNECKKFLNKEGINLEWN